MVVFLPGASGARDFWAPVAKRLPDKWPKSLISWPGAGNEPHDPAVHGFDDLIAFVAAQLLGRSDLVAQSMGCAVAIGLATRYPELVRRLVLVAGSGGIDVGALGAAEWRDDYREEYPDAAGWISRDKPDYSGTIGIVTAPALLIWGDADPLSPLAVGEQLSELLPNSSLRVIRGGNHSLAHDRPDEVAALIQTHLE